MTTDEIHSIKTDVALIKKDVKLIERSFLKVDASVAQMSDILKAVAVQENILENNERRISSLEEKLMKHHEEEVEFRKDLNQKLEDMKTTSQNERERRHKEVIEAIQKSHEALGKKLDQQDKRIRALENWRWYLLGAAAVIMFIITKFPWTALF